VTWSVQLQDTPAPAWTLTYYLQRAGAAPIAIVAAASGADHVVSVAAATTATWTAGAYAWTARATDGTDVRTVGTGQLVVLPDPSTTHDPRTHAERCLASIEQALEASVGSATVECELDGVRVKKDRSELLRLRGFYAFKVRRERGYPVCTRVRL
jgi:hypothetical protein